MLRRIIVLMISIIHVLGMAACSPKQDKEATGGQENNVWQSMTLQGRGNRYMP